MKSTREGKLHDKQNGTDDLLLFSYREVTNLFVIWNAVYLFIP